MFYSNDRLEREHVFAYEGEEVLPTFTLISMKMGVDSDNDAYIAITYTLTYESGNVSQHRARISTQQAKEDSAAMKKIAEALSVFEQYYNGPF